MFVTVLSIVVVFVACAVLRLIASSFLVASVIALRRSGKLCGMDVKLYSNAGCSLDLSASVMERALFHIDNCYRYIHFRHLYFSAELVRGFILSDLVTGIFIIVTFTFQPNS